MIDESTLLALAERVEQATGPDRELDGEIDRLFNERPQHGDYHAGERCIWRVDGHSGLCVRSDGFARESFCAASYTESLDAAMSLAGEYTYIEFRRFDDGTFGCDVEAIGVKAATISATASTQVLALLSCLLRAIAQTTGSKQ